MSEVNGCRLPEDLYYWPDKHVWARPEPDGTVVVGMTDVAQSLAGKIIVASLRVGKKLVRGKSAGTLESGKWVGTVSTPVAGEVVEINSALKGNASIINDDPYGSGWLVRVQPVNWEEDRELLVTGPEGIQKYQEKLDSEGISCKH